VVALRAWLGRSMELVPTFLPCLLTPPDPMAGGTTVVAYIDTCGKVQ
jgi:hypothetical protein